MKFLYHLVVYRTDHHGKKYFLCVFFVVLLVSPAPILTEALEKERETENKRQAQALLPLAYYARMTVSAPLFFALVAAYGIHAVTSYAIKRAGTLYYASKGNPLHVVYGSPQ